MDPVAIDQNGNAMPFHRGIQSLCRLEGENLEVVGTVFFVAEDGLFLTAKHVFEECRNAWGEVAPEPFVWTNNQNQGPVVLQVMNDNRTLIRQIHSVCAHPTADICLGYLAPLEDGGRRVVNIYTQLELQIVPVGSRVVSIGLPEGQVHNLQDRQEVRIAPCYEEGPILEVFDDGRRGLLEGITYTAEVYLRGGSSGGPVFGPNGRVFAVNSTGLAPGPDGEIPIGRLTSVLEAMNLWLPDYPPSQIQGRHNLNLRELLQQRG